MAPGLKFLCLLLICVSIVVNVETKATKHGKSTTKPYHSSKPVTSKPVKYTPKPTYHPPPKTGSLRQPPSYPNSGGLSGGGSSNTHKQTAPQSPSYPGSGGLSGGGSTNIQKQTVPQQHTYPNQGIQKQTVPQSQSYPGGGGLSGGGSTNIQKQTVPQQHTYPNQGIQKQTVPQSQAYPGGGGLSGGGSTNIQNQTVPQQHTYPNQGIQKQTVPQSQSYPGGGGLSGGGSTNIQKQTVPQSHTYPNQGGVTGGLNATNQRPPVHTYPQGGLSGGGSTNLQTQTAPQTHTYTNQGGVTGGLNATNQRPPVHTYPQGGLSGGGSTNIQKQTVPQTHTYPNQGGNAQGVLNSTSQQRPPVHTYPQGGLSGGGTPNQQPPHHTIHTQPPVIQQHTYPNTHGQSGGGFKPGYNPNPQSPTTIHVHHPSPSKIYVRNRHTIHVHDSNPIIIHHYPYSPPSHIYYVSNGMQAHYPVYRETPPEYVYQYRSSKSRYNILLTGLGLYNLGHMSKNRDTRNFHDNYRPGPIEVCKFGVKYDSGKYQEMDIDCRLITDFIWTVRNANKVSSGMIQRLHPNGALALSQDVMKGNIVSQRLLPNGTMVHPQLVWYENSDTVLDALDPRFDGAPLVIKSGMKCYMKYFDGYILTAPVKKYVSCNLLRTYVKSSFSSASKLVSSVLPIVITIAVSFFN